MASVFSNPVSDTNVVKSDIFGSAFDSTVDIYKSLSQFAGSGEDGKVTLPSGEEIDVNTITGMTTYSTYLQFLQAHKELIDNILFSLKPRKQVSNLLSS